MLRILVTFLIVGMTSYFALGQDFWTPVDATQIQLRSESSRQITPRHFKSFSLDKESLVIYLQNAPIESKEVLKNPQFTLSLPNNEGGLDEFVVWSSPIMEEDLAAKHPEIKSYKGYKKNDRSVNMRMTITPYSFYGAIRSTDNMIYIDQYSTERSNIFMAYDTDDYTDETLLNRVICGTDDALFTHKDDDRTMVRNPLQENTELRTYRLALGCTGEWGILRGTREKALAEMVAFVDRANVYFENEISARLIIIDSNENCINLDGNLDPYNNSREGLSLVGQNTAVLNQRVGYNNYDIGHMFSICYDVGGVAAGTLCSQAKGAGVTCHNSTSISSGIVLVFVHEVGHQMSASHTFNNCPGQEGQTPSGTGYEPGSGSTIMAYPGACGSSNLGVPRDDYYHAGTLDQILFFTARPGAEAYDCAETIDFGNIKPEIVLNYPEGLYIPQITPFYLTGKATDANGDKMTYNWDQMDAQGSSPLGMPAGNAPIFRSLKPGKSTTRFFPNTNRILNWEFNNVLELMPTYGRDLTFRFVVRDNHPMGSAAVWEEVKFKVAPNSGPFEITYPNEPLKLKIGDKVDVTWDVSNTDIAPVNCKYVDIFFALENDLNFDGPNMIPAAIQVPNDGYEAVIVPNIESGRARIIIKASDNIFFTVSKANSRIDAPTEPTFFMDIKEPIRTLCLPENPNFEINTLGFLGLSDTIQFEIEAPADIVATLDKQGVLPGESNSLHLDLTKISHSGIYEVLTRTFVPGVDTIERTIRLYVTTTDLDNIALSSPENGENGVGPTQKYRWERKKDAISYILQVASSPAFSPEDIVFETERQDTFYNSNTFLKVASIYYWRIKSYNLCKDGEWSDIFAFNTESKDCYITPSGPLSINISQSGTPTISSEIYVSGEGNLDDVNVLNIRALHQRASDLIVSLESPSGTQVKLWGNKCPTGNGINVGLDDQSNDYFQCPINQGRIYRPENPLSKFNGESINGYWKLIFEDTKTGDGGRLQNWDLELCSNITLNPPYLVNNEELEVAIGETKVINPDKLKCEDNDNEDDELIYTLVASPIKGILLYNGVPALTGEQFSQEDINNGILSYMSTSGKEESDSFLFTVSDGKGGWISITTFNINIVKTTSTEEKVYLTPQVLVYPNPASDEVNIQSFESNEFTGWAILDITGKTVLSKQETGSKISINVSRLSEGMYMLRLHINDKIVTKKLVLR